MIIDFAFSRQCSKKELNFDNFLDKQTSALGFYFSKSRKLVSESSSLLYYPWVYNLWYLTLSKEQIEGTVLLVYKCIEVQDAVEGLQCSEGNGVNCVIPLCPGLEELSHVKVCIFYQTKWSDKWTTDKELVDYLLKINREWLLVYKMPLF